MLYCNDYHYLSFKSIRALFAFLGLSRASATLDIKNPANVEIRAQPASDVRGRTATSAFVTL